MFSGGDSNNCPVGLFFDIQTGDIVSDQFNYHTVKAAVVADPWRRVPVENSNERPHGEVNVTTIGKGISGHLIHLIVNHNKAAVSYTHLTLPTILLV